ncbi:phage tail protein [Pseudomonas viridiflava]|uniref:phage tail protein n=1 Tax=Pseudomonas viridiflava TaxID=33069 RepID=UPI000F0353FA|nr:phage tail protein [Pseudomonas viridiflava]
MDYPKSVPGVGLVSGKFVDENPATGTPGSLIPAQWGNSVTQEILNVILGAGLVPSEADVTQLHRAILGLAASDYKKSVRCATTMAIGLSGLQTIDDVTLVAGDRVLVKNQDSPAQNWIYLAAADAWTRAQDANESAECPPGHLVPVQAGTRNGGTVWQLTNTTAPVLGTTGLVFERALGRSGVAAGSYSRVKVNRYGQVEEGSNATTLAGYGVTDAYTKAESDFRDTQRPLRDSITHVGMAGNQADSPYMRRESDGGVYYLQSRLGFTPVQQGGGVGQQGNLIRIGWSGSSLKATVDAADLGNLWYSSNFDPATKANYADVYAKSEVDTRVGSRVLADSITYVGLASGDLNQPYMRRAADLAMCALQTRLGYTPVQQGGGVGQQNHPIKLGWSGSNLKATVDTIDLGNLWYSANFDPATKANFSDVYGKSEVDARIGNRALADSITYVGLASGDITQPYMRRAADSAMCALQARLGYTPVEQGGGPNMTSNKLRIGYNGAGSLRLQVDTTDCGDLINDQNLLAKIVGIGLGGTGSYAFARVINSMGAVNQGGLVAGNNLIYSSTNGGDGSTNNSGTIGIGTWRAHGAFSNGERTLFQRTS